MYTDKTNVSTRIFVTVTFLMMIVVNTLANSLPINGQSSGQVSDSYPNLFAPAGLTFSIWGVIYLLLAVSTLYQIGLFQGSNHTNSAELLNKIGILFSISSLANAAWIFSWHYHLIPLSMILIIVILVCLIMINQRIKSQLLTKKEKFFIQLPFSIYFGWITVATIANATTLLVSLGWIGVGSLGAVWTISMLLLGLIIGLRIMLKNSDIAYGLVLIWAYAGILLKHTSVSGFRGQYPIIISVVRLCLFLFVIGEAYIIFYKKGK